MRSRSKLIRAASFSVFAALAVGSSLQAEERAVRSARTTSFVVESCDTCAPTPKGVKGFFQRWRDGVMGTYDRSRTLPSGLPQGRTYYNGRYFGNFNNRFYGPQYGYF